MSFRRKLTGHLHKNYEWELQTYCASPRLMAALITASLS
jgi:hypothetical protein